MEGIVCEAFDLGSAAVPWIARLPSAAGWYAFMAFSGGTPVGTGALYTFGDAAFTDFGATAPACRGRGAQTANLAHRVRAALEMGCARVHTCNGHRRGGRSAAFLLQYPQMRLSGKPCARDLAAGAALICAQNLQAFA